MKKTTDVAFSFFWICQLRKPQSEHSYEILHCPRMTRDPKISRINFTNHFRYGFEFPRARLTVPKLALFFRLTNVYCICTATSTKV